MNTRLDMWCDEAIKAVFNDILEDDMAQIEDEAKTRKQAEPARAKEWDAVVKGVRALRSRIAASEESIAGSLYALKHHVLRLESQI